MTRDLLTLIRYDLAGIRHWFSAHFLVKTGVASAFLGIFFSLYLLIYLYCYFLFKNLGQYEQYGQFVAHYLMVSAIIFLLVFTTLATTLSSLLSTYSRTQVFKNLLIFPLPNLVLGAYYYLRFIGTSLISSLVLILPIFMAYSKAFAISPLVSLILTISLTMIIHTLGLSTAMLLSWVFGKNRSLLFLFFILIVIISFFLTSNVILPQNFSLLYQSPAEAFFNLTQSLPVTNSILYQYLLNPSQPAISTIVIILFSLSLTSLGLVFISGLIRHNLVMANSINIRPAYLSVSLITSRLPITKKDILYLLRRPQEILNIAFFLAGGIIITLLIQNLRHIRPFTRAEADTIGLFAFAWFGFFAISYCLRFIMPLLSIEGNTLSVLLSTSRSKLYPQKLITALWLTIPLLLTSLLLWFVFRLPIDKQSYIVATAKLILFSALLSFFQGWIYPDFKDSQSPDRVSTSLSGLLVLILSLAYLLSQYLYLSDSSYWHPLYEIIALTILLILGYSSRRKLILLD